MTNVEPLAAGLGEGRLGDDRSDVVLLVTVLGEHRGWFSNFGRVAEYETQRIMQFGAKLTF